MPHPAPMTGRILLVDDDEAIRHLLSRLLTGLGCDVVTAPDGVAALELATHGPPPDLVISDVVMPRLDGLALAECLRSACPDVEVLLMSGFSNALAERPLPPGTAFVAKPIDIPLFIASVRRLLASRQRQHL